MGNYQAAGLLEQQPPDQQQYTYTLEGEGLMGLYFEVSDEGACFDGFVHDEARSQYEEKNMTQGDRLLSVNNVTLTGLSCADVIALLEDLQSQRKTLVLEASLLLPTGASDEAKEGANEVREMALR